MPITARTAALAFIAGLVLVLSLCAQCPAREADDEIDNWAQGVTQRDLLEFFRIVGATDEQKTPLTDLFTAYRGRLNDAGKKFNEYWEAASNGRLEDGEQATPEELKSVEAGYKRHIVRLQQTFLDDFALLLTEEQRTRLPEAIRWMERRIKRRDLLIGGQLAARGADLTAIVTRLLKPGPIPTDVRVVLDQYEEELDHAIDGCLTQLKQIDEMERQDASSKTTYSDLVAIFQQSFARQAAATVNLRAISETAMKRLVPLVPDDRRDRFQIEYFASIPNSLQGDDYSFNLTLSRALALPDLTPDQRAAIVDARIGYDRLLLPIVKQQAAAYALLLDAGKYDELMALRLDRDGSQNAIVLQKRKLITQAAAKVRTVLTESQVDTVGPPIKMIKIQRPNFDE